MKKKVYRYQKVAYLGIPGSNTFIAGQKYFGKKIHMKPFVSINKIIQIVSTDSSLCGIIPLENSTTGSILESFDSLVNSSVSITGEIIMHIHHNLLSKEKNIIGTEKCLSHPQAIAQCSSFFTNHPDLVPVATIDTATAARQISISNSKDCAIAGKEAAKIYKLNILEENIEDNSHNYTRFAIVSKTANTNGEKVSLVFSVEHKPGSLFATLEPYSKHSLNLTKIESRPVFGKPWEYIFFVDLEIGDKKDQFDRVLYEMKENVNFLRILGFYRKGDIYES